MVTWFFENHQFTNAWIPFDRINQKKLEYVYRHHEEILTYIKTHIKEGLSLPPMIKKEVDIEEEDPSIHSFIQYNQNCIHITLTDTHFEQPITLYPILMLGSLPNRDILIIRSEIMDHKNKYLLGDD